MTSKDDITGPRMAIPGATSDAPAFALSIVVPVYNGAKSVPDLVAALSELDVPGGHEIILVDDGSPDESAEVCRALARQDCPVPVTAVLLSRNFGEHNAVMAGLHHVRGAYVVTMDDDLQNPPGEVTRLFEATRDGGHDVLYTYYAVKQHSSYRNLGSWLANRTADLVLDKPRGLYLSSFRCLRRGLVDQLLAYDGPFPYVDGLISQVTQSIGTLEVAHLPRAEGRSNYTLRRLVRLWLTILLNFSTLPLRISSILGLAMSALGLLLAVAVVFERLFFDVPLGWGSLMSALLVFSGVQLLMLGLIGEYLGRTYLSVNRKPQFVVRTVVEGAGRPSA